MRVGVSTDSDADYFRSRVLTWWPTIGRDFPWRHATCPYHVLVAEMMLRRTQARQVERVYKEFLKQFPSVKALAVASEQAIADRLWSLGLAWRVPAFRQMARMLIDLHEGEVPRDREALLALPGVGDYVADAVRCFAYGDAVALLDTNTVRVAGRFFGFQVNPESRRRVWARQAVGRLVDSSSPRESNWALLDLAATVCGASSPLHEQCPVADHCAWWRTAQQSRAKQFSPADGG